MKQKIELATIKYGNLIIKLDKSEKSYGIHVYIINEGTIQHPKIEIDPTFHGIHIWDSGDVTIPKGETK